MSSTTSNPPLKPAVLAQRYRLDRRLAQGGMAEVWLAFDMLLTRPVAVKVLKASLAVDPVVTERFRREAIAVAQLSHPNIVAVYDAISEGGRQAVVMQLVNGKSLRQLLDEQKRLSPDLTIHIGSCVASALDAAHHAGLVHRDVKPGNILITPDGRVLLTDFGIAKGVEPSGDDLTNDNIMMGTAKYLSPEQVRGRRLDGRADLYALGLVLYECLAGRVPFLGGNDVETALARLQRAPTDISSLRPTLPYGLAELIHRLLARRPDERYPSGAALRAALNDVAARAKDPALDPTYGDRSGEQLRRDRTPSGAQPPAATAQATPAGMRRAAPTPPKGGPVTGYQPVRATGRPAGTPIRTDRDHTPTKPGRPDPRPNREFEQRRSPSLLVVGGLLLAAILLGALMWNRLRHHDDGEAFEPSIVTSVPVASVGPSTTDVAPASGPVVLVTAAAFDPDGDGTENDDRAAFVLDGDPATAWNTVCYSSQYLGGKVGVGVSVSLGSSSSGTLTVDVASAPWNIDVFASAADAAPTTMAGWGERIASDSGSTARAMSIPITTAARHFLVLFHEIGPSSQCSNDNPYRGVISDVRFQAAP